MKEIEALLENDTAGEPTGPLKWSRKSTYTVSQTLQQKDLAICPVTTGKIMKSLNYSLQVNRKMIAETHHPDRNRQFEIIAQRRAQFVQAGQPIISVDSKKKELIGNFKNPGQKWTKANQPEGVLNHDFPSQALGVARPYGIYDMAANYGFVVVGQSCDTPEFAVEAIESWLTTYARPQYPSFDQLLIFCDAGGSNGYRPRLWKYALYKKICCHYQIAVVVCHYPTGASKWNPCDHRLFSFITMNWAGQPLRSYELMLNYVRQTTTKQGQGLHVDALLNTKEYVSGTKVSDEQMNEINLKAYDVLPQWNYTIYPN